MATVQPSQNTAPVVQEKKSAPIQETKIQLDFEGAYQEYLSGKKGTVAQGFFRSIDMYIERMSPGIQNTNEKGVENQYMLWLALTSLLNEGSDADFKRIWTVFLWKVHKHSVKGAFSRTHVYRFFEYWGKGKETETAMQNLLDLILQTANDGTNTDPKSQMGVHYELTRGLAVGFTDKARTRLTGFYSYLVTPKK